VAGEIPIRQIHAATVEEVDELVDKRRQGSIGRHRPS
jgi:hypothetical protein